MASATATNAVRASHGSIDNSFEIGIGTRRFCPPALEADAPGHSDRVDERAVSQGYFPCTGQDSAAARLAWRGGRRRHHTDALRVGRWVRGHRPADQRLL